MKALRRYTFVALVAVAVWLVPASSGSSRTVSAAAQVLAGTPLWLVPTGLNVPLLEGAAAALAKGNAAAALPVFERATTHPIVGRYARLYQGRAELAMNRADAAMGLALLVINAAPAGALAESALWLLADAAERQGKWPEAVQALVKLTELPSATPALAYLRLGRAAFKAEERTRAATSFTTVYYEYPLAPEAAEAESELKRYYRWPPASGTFDRAERRAEMLYAGRQYAAAREAFAELLTVASPDNLTRIEFRLAQCDVHLKRYGPARDWLRAYLERASTRLDEAGYFHLNAVRGLRQDAEYVPLVRTFVEAHPASAFAEAALNDLATYYILSNEDAAAASVFREMVQRFPAGAYGDRAAWRWGWWSFRNGDYAEAARVFEAAAVTFPRADYRPSWLYWSARAHERLGNREGAHTGYQRTIASYRNSYYGRQAMNAMAGIDDPGRRSAPTPTGRPVSSAPPARPAAFPAASARSAAVQPPAPLQIAAGAPPPATTVIQALLAAGLYDDAILELRKVQRDEGSSPLIEATMAYALGRKGDLRPSINTMRRAYPQFMAQGGEALPVDILKTIFPLEHWGLIRQQAAARSLNPYLMAALIAQESTFQADVQSPANAWGLMQIIPATGRRYAASLKIGRFSTARLTEPEVNVRIGMAYFSDLLKRFGEVAQALAAYNAGENRVERWRAERPGVDQDEFIDDIPFPETQNYVKRIIGTAEDYRLLYGTLNAGMSGGVTESRR